MNWQLIHLIAGLLFIAAVIWMLSTPGSGE
jgi:hypothetical protein